MVEKCIRCDARGDEVRLYDAIYQGRMSSICERCSIIENVPTIKKPDASQLKDSEKGVGVYSRMKRLAGIKDKKEEENYFREDKLKALEKMPELELPKREKLRLIEHFHWEVMKNRRRKGLTQKKLAEVLGESEIVIQMIEKGKLPENAESLIRKLEQFLQIRLRGITERERFLREQRAEPVLLDEYGNELEFIPEEKIAIPESEIEDEEEIDMRGVDMEKGELDIEKADLSSLRIKDLKNLHRKKIEVSRQEKIEEQKRIEERNRLVEARKEELRLMREKESKELDKVLGGTELIGGGHKKPKTFSKEDLKGDLV